LEARVGLVCLDGWVRYLSQLTNRGWDTPYRASLGMKTPNLISHGIWDGFLSGKHFASDGRLLPEPMDPFCNQLDRAPDDRQCMPFRPPPQIQRVMKCVRTIQIWEDSKTRAWDGQKRGFKKKGANSLTVTDVVCMYSDIYPCGESCGRVWC
jgi:hypothetical protein